MIAMLDDDDDDSCGGGGCQSVRWWWFVQSSVLAAKFKSNVCSLRSDAGDELSKFSTTNNHHSVTSLSGQSTSSAVTSATSPRSQSRHALVCRETADLHVDGMASVHRPASTIDPLLCTTDDERPSGVEGNVDTVGGKDDEVQEEQPSEMRSAVEDKTMAAPTTQSLGDNSTDEHQTGFVSDDNSVIV